MKILLSTALFCLLQLNSIAQGQLVPQTGHNGAFCMALSPDDKMLLTTGSDGRIMLWDVQATKALQNFKATPASIYCSAWKQDGSAFAVGTSDSVLILFDGKTAKEIRRFKTPFITTELCFNPKHEVIAIGGNNGMIKVLDAKKGDVYFSFQPDNFVSGLAFSNNGALLFTAGWNIGVIAYEMNQGKSMMTLPTVVEHFTTGIELSANNEFLLMHMKDGTTEVVNLLQGKNVGSLTNTMYYEDANDKFYLDPALTADNLFVLSVNNENNFVVTHQKKNITQIYNNSFSRAKINAILPSHDGQFFIMGDINGSISSVYFNETLFDNESPLLWRKMQNSPERIYKVDFLDHDETLALTGNGHYQLNMATGDMHRRDLDSANVSNMEYTTRYFTIDKVSGTYYSADMLRNTGFEMTVDGSVFALRAICFSKDTNVVALVNNSDQMVVYDIRNEKILNQHGIYDGQHYDFMLFNGTLNDHFVFRLGQELHFMNTHGETTGHIPLPDKKDIVNICTGAAMENVYVLNKDQQLSCYDFKTGKPVALKGELAGLKARMIETSPDGKTLVAYSNDALRFYNTSDGKTAFSIPTNGDLPYSMTFNSKGNHLAIAMENGITQLWDLQKKQKLLNVLVTPQDGMMAYTDDHYYMATKEAARQLVFTQGSQPVSLANAELTFNRPDKVLEKIGMSNQKLLNAYRFAYERRLKRSKFSNNGDEAHVPSVTLVNQQDLKASTNKGNVSLKIKATDGMGKLARLHVWINNVPVFGQDGLTLEAKNEIEKEVMLDLVSGTNRIKFSAVNANGTESEKQEITVVSTNAAKPDLYLLTIGTSNYKNAAFNLTYAAKDANDLAALFSTLDKNGEKPYTHIFTKTLVNENVTAANLKKTKDFLQQAKSNDVVMVFVAGHGVRDEQMKYFFGTYDMNFDQPAGKGFSEEDFAQLVDGLKAVKRLIFFDTCLSGELDKEEAEQTLASNTPVKKGDVSFRTAGAGIRTKTSGIHNASALMREIYNDLDEGTGSTVISSAGGAEFAMESSEWKNGLFTYCFVNGLKNYAADKNQDKQITVTEIQDYVRREVIRLSNGKQQPSFKDENMIMNYRIW